MSIYDTETKQNRQRKNRKSNPKVDAQSTTKEETRLQVIAHYNYTLRLK